jgi:chitin synthase
MSAARKIRSYRYVQGASSAPSLDEDDYQDYQDDGDDYHDDYDVEEQEPQIPAQGPQGHSPSRTLQYALGGSSSSSSQTPNFPTFDSIAEAVTTLQSRYSSTSSSAHNAAPPPPRVGAHTPPYERPPSSASTATTSYTVATDYAAPTKLRQANRFQSDTRPLSQQPPFLPTIDSGEPLQWNNMDIAEEYEDPFSDGSHSQQQTMLPYASEPLRRRSLDSSASRDSAKSSVPGDEVYLHHLHHPPRPPSQLSAATSRSAGSSRGGSSARSATPSQWHVLPFPASSQDNNVEPTIGLVSRSNPTQQPHYNPVQSQALTPPMNRIVQRRSPQKPVTPIDHFRHDTEAYASGRDSLLAHTTPRSRSPTPPIGDDSYEAASSISRHHTGTTHYAETQPTVMSQYTGGTEGRDDEEYDEESLEDEDRDGSEEEKKEKPKKSKFQEYLKKARNQGDAFLNQTPDEKTKPQNVFADPRRVIFPNPLSADVPETPVETRHFGPAPVGRVARRNKTTKRVPLTNGNLVLDLPVPPKLVLPRTGHPEVMKTRYTAVTGDPDDFEKNGHFLRQNQTNRRTELFICITMYNVSGLTRSVT